MFTQHYKGFWLQGSFASNTIRIQCADLSVWYEAKSLDAAKRAIRRRLKKEKCA